jgi:hypothetical protein
VNERCFYDNLFVQSFGDGVLHAVHETLPAIRIATIIFLGNSDHQGIAILHIGPVGGHRQEKKVAPRYEGVFQASGKRLGAFVVFHLTTHVREGAGSGEKRTQLHNLLGHSGHLRDFPSALEFGSMALAVIKSETHHVLGAS